MFKLALKVKLTENILLNKINIELNIYLKKLYIFNLYNYLSFIFSINLKFLLNF